MSGVLNLVNDYHNFKGKGRVEFYIVLEWKNLFVN